MIFLLPAATNSFLSSCIGILSGDIGFCIVCLALLPCLAGGGGSGVLLGCLVGGGGGGGSSSGCCCACSLAILPSILNCCFCLFLFFLFAFFGLSSSGSSPSLFVPSGLSVPCLNFFGRPTLPLGSILVSGSALFDVVTVSIAWAGCGKIGIAVSLDDWALLALSFGFVGFLSAAATGGAKSLVRLVLLTWVVMLVLLVLLNPVEPCWSCWFC